MTRQTLISDYSAEQAVNQNNLDDMSAEDTLHFLTPFAFKMDKSLFGLPLASPSRRGIALLIDLTLIALLSDVSGGFLALAIAITLYRLGNKKRAQARGKSTGYKRRTIMRFVAAFMVFIILLDTLPPLLKYFGMEDTSAEITVIDTPSHLEQPLLLAGEELEDAQFEDELLIDIAELTSEDETEKTNKPVYSIIEWVKGIIKDLGLGFGWATFYFTAFIALGHGQTLGKKLLGIKVLQLDGTPLSLWDSFGRYGGYGAGIATGLLGFIQIYWDPNRQAIHDKISATVVIDIRKEKLNKSP